MASLSHWLVFMLLHGFPQRVSILWAGFLYLVILNSSPAGGRGVKMNDFIRCFSESFVAV